MSPATLLEKGVLKGNKQSVADVKILGNGELSKKLTLEHCSVSEAARAKITAAGGTVQE